MSSDRNSYLGISWHFIRRLHILHSNSKLKYMKLSITVQFFTLKNWAYRVESKLLYGRIPSNL